MPADIDAIREKLVRAREHLELFKQESISYFKHCGAVFDMVVNLKDRQMAIRLTMKESPPPRLSILVGDCVHNTRSALDNIVCALVRTGNPDSSCKGRQFPVSTDIDKYRAERNEILKGVPEKARQLIDKLNPSTVHRPDEIHAVTILNTLSNRDKHRAPPLTAAYAANSRFVIDYTEGRQWSLTLRQPLYRNSQIPIPFFPVLIKHRERLKAIGTFHMAFVDQKMFGVSMPDEPVAELLQFSVDFVEKTVIPALTPFLNK